MLRTFKLHFFQGIIEPVRFIISQENVRSKRLNKIQQTSSNIVYFGLIGHSKLQQ